MGSVWEELAEWCRRISSYSRARNLAALGFQPVFQHMAETADIKEAAKQVLTYDRYGSPVSRSQRRFFKQLAKPLAVSVLKVIDRAFSSRDREVRGYAAQFVVAAMNMLDAAVCLEGESDNHSRQEEGEGSGESDNHSRQAEGSSSLEGESGGHGQQAAVLPWNYVSPFRFSTDNPDAVPTGFGFHSEQARFHGYSQDCVTDYMHWNDQVGFRVWSSMEDSLDEIARVFIIHGERPKEEIPQRV